MKRILAWVLLLTMLLGMFAGCKKTESTTPTVSGDYVTAEAAMEYLKALYKNADKATPTPRDYSRYGVIRVGGTPFEIVWSVDLGEDMIKIVPGDEETVTIDINEQCEKDTPYVLTATITDEGGNSVSHSWNYILPKAMDIGQILRDAYALADGETLPYQVTLTGKVKSIDTMYNPEYQNITVTMVIEGYEDYPIECYRLKGEGVDTLQMGNIITVTGTLKNYKGTIEFDSGCILENVEKGDAVDAPADPLEIVKAAYALADGANLPYIATLTGKVVEIDTPYDPDYGNITVSIAVEGAENQPIKCYRLKGTGVDQVAVDDIITVTGIIKNYKGTIEFDSGCQMLDRISGGREAEQPSTDPVKIFADAKKLQAGKHLNYYATLTGKVIDIESPYDQEYQNITVVMSVKGYEGNPIICYRLKGSGVEKIARGDTITVKGIIENYKGKLEFGSGCTLLDRVSGGGVAKPESSNAAAILADAAKLTDNQHLDYYANLTGKVIDIESPYDKEYENITVVMDVNGTEITCYRMKGDGVSRVARGDTISVRGVIENYKGKLEFGTGCTMTARTSGGGVAKPETSNQTTILTDAAKLAAGEHLDYYATLTGKVIEIESPYDKEYGNITVVMDVDGTEITCYRMKTGASEVAKVASGDTITVRGVLENYNGKLEFGTGCMLQKRLSGGGVAKPESSDTSAILADAATLAQDEKLEYYANLTGIVTEIDSPYDSGYKNISVYMNVDGKVMLCYRLKSGAADVSQIAVNDIISVRGVLTNYKGNVQFDSGATLEARVSGGGVAKGESWNAAEILSDAEALSKGDKLNYYANLTGMVTWIDSPYDSKYGNISVYMNVDGTQLLCYRLKSGDADVSQIAVGDIINVRGVIENYDGDIQFGSGASLMARYSGGGVAPQESFDKEAILAAADRLTEGEKLNYYTNLTGTVTWIDSPYDSKYGNISVYINVDGRSLLCYRMKSGDADASQIAVGDIIAVRGVLTKYKGNVQFNTGCTLEARYSGGGVAPQESFDKEAILAAADRLTENEALTYFSSLTGLVTWIETPYDSNYDNISVYMDVDGRSMLCYRMKSGEEDASKIAVGDIITVRGVITNHKGKVQFGENVTLEARYSGGGIAPQESWDQEAILSAAAQLEQGETLNFFSNLTGRVIWINTPYDPEYKNLTVTIDVDGTQMLCYRLKSGDDTEATDVRKIAVGDVILVHGLLTNFYGDVQFAAGCTMEARYSGGGVPPTTEDPGASVEGIKISFADKANRTSLSETQQVWQQNGITVTNDKAGSSTNIADYANPVRFYRNTSVTIEYPAMTRITFNVAFADRVAGLVDSLKTMENIVVTTDGLLVTVDLYEAVDSFVIPKLADQTRIRDITVATGTTPPENGGSGDDSGSGDSGSTGPSVDMVTDVKAETAYKWYVQQETLGKTLYFAGSAISANYPFYFKTTENISEAVDVYLEEVTGGYRLYFMDGETKTYVVMYQDGTHYSIKLTTEPSTVYTYNTQYNTLTSYNVDTDCYMGTYGDKDTISCSKMSYIGSSFPAHFGVEGTGSGSGGSGSGDSGSTAPTVDMVTDVKPETAYKWYVQQETLGKTLYFAGSAISANYPFYFKTTENISEAVDVYLEEVTGGYRLYFMDGETKTYVVMYQDGTHYSIKMTTEPSTVYTYNTQYNTLTSYNVDTDCYMGTYGDKNTISCSKMSYIDSSFPSHFGVEGTGSGSGDSGSGDSGSTAPTVDMVTDVKPETAYKWYIEQETLGKTLYFTGEILSENNPWYFKTTENISEAVDVYLEEAEGGYRLYFMDGETKTYIVMYQDGTHYSIKMTTEASTVYTYNTQYNTLTAMNVDQECYMGTYGEKNTFSCSKMSYIDSSFPSHFGVEGTGTGSGSGSGSGSEDTAPSVEMVTDVQAETAYKLYVEKADKTLYFNGAILNENNPWYMGSTQVLDEAADVYLEEVTGGYRLYIMDGNTKTYLVMYQDGTHYSLKLTTEPSTVYTFDSDNNTLKALNGDKDCYIGSKGTYPSISCNTYDSEETCYFAHLGTVVEGGSGDDSGSGSGDSGSTLDPNDLAALLQEAAQLENGQYLDVETTQTGVISTVPTYNSNYNSYTFSIDVDGTAVYCYSVSIVDDVEPKRGDTVTVTGKLTAYNGAPQFDKTCTVVWVSAGEQQNEGVIYTFSSFNNGVQYAENEVHELDDKITVVTNLAHFRSDGIRMYDTDKHSEVVIQSAKQISKIALNVGYKTGALRVSVSDNGEVWTALDDVVVASTSFTDYTLDVPSGTKYVKVESVGGTQLRMPYFIVTFAE